MTHQTYRWICCMAGAAALALGIPCARAALIRHLGDVNPTSEDARPLDVGDQFWSELIDPPGAIVGAAGDSESAWKVDTVGRGAAEHKYNSAPTAADVADANANGFRMRARLRLPTVSDAVGNGSGVQYLDGPKVYRMFFGTDADGDPIVGVSTDGSPFLFTLEGAGNTGYHDYELVRYLNGQALLKIDGVIVGGGFTGQTIGVGFTQFLWGDFTGGDNATTHFASVIFETPAPEPTGVVLLAVAALPAAMRRRRRH